MRAAVELGLAQPNLKVYYARAMDGVGVLEILSEEESVKRALDRRGFVLANPWGGRRASAGEARSAIRQNRRLLMQSDVVLVNLTRPEYKYVGAIFEIADAAEAGLPVAVYVASGELASRVYFQHYCDFICETLEQALEYVWHCCSREGIRSQLSARRAYSERLAHVSGSRVECVGEQGPENLEAYSRERCRLQEKLRQYCRGRTVLKLGCGDRDYIATISDVAKSVVCVDSNEGMICEAELESRTKPARLEFVKGDLFGATLRLAACDSVVCYFLLTLLPPPAQTELLSRMKMWVRGAGYFLFGEPSEELRATTSAIGLGRRRLERRRVGDTEFVLYKEQFTPSDLRALLEANGFKVVDCPEDARWFSFCAATLGE